MIERIGRIAQEDIMRVHTRPAAAALLALLVAAGCNQPSEDQEIFDSQLAGGNEVPPRSTGATGAAGVTFDGSRFHYSVEVHGINSVVGAHIHSGAAGVNGPIRISLFPGPGLGNVTTATGAVDGVLASGSFSGQDLQGITQEQFLNELRNGTAYVNVHTSQFPGGEIRGQTRRVQ